MYKKQADRKKRKNFVPELFERYFRRNEGTTDYATIPEVTLAGDFVITFSAMLVAGKTQTFMGSTGDTANFFSFFDNGTMINRLSSVQTTAVDVSSYMDNRFHTISMTRTGTLLDVSIDQVSVLSESNAGTFFFDTLYNNDQLQYGVQGILANLKIWDNGTLIRDYPLDDNSDILRNRATVLGGELWGSNTLSSANNASVTPIVGGYTIISTSGASGNVANGGVDQSVDNMVIGTTYKFSVASTEPVNLVVYNSSFGQIASGINAVVFTAVAGVKVYVCPRSTNPIDVTLLSIRQADGYGTVINGNASDWGLFQQQATGEWLGQELVTQAVWENPASSGAQWTLTSNQWVLNGDGSFSGLSLIASGFLPEIYRISGDLVSLTGSGLSLTDAGITPESLITASGAYERTLSKALDGNQNYKRISGIVTATLDKPSIKEVLNVA